MIIYLYFEEFVFTFFKDYEYKNTTISKQNIYTHI